MYPVYRLLIPYYDRQRTVFQLKEAELAATISEALGLDNGTSTVAIQLKSWKRNEQNHQGDFSKVLQEVRAWDGAVDAASRRSRHRAVNPSVFISASASTSAPTTRPSPRKTATAIAAASARVFTSPRLVIQLQPPLASLTPVPPAPPRARGRSGTSVRRLLACVEPAPCWTSKAGPLVLLSLY